MCSPHAARQPLHCILPPHILRNIAINGSPAEREVVLASLGLDATARAQRAAIALQQPSEVRAAAITPHAAQKRRTIFDAQGTEQLPGKVRRGEGQRATKDPAVDEAYDGLGATWDFFFDVFGRNSLDGNGLALDATVHYGRRYDNAFWDGRQMVFGDGDGRLFNRFTISLDVIAHELTHGVTSYERNLRYSGQSGALNESVSDVFGSLVLQKAKKQTADKASWLIGEGLLAPKVKGVALRSMKAPGTAFDDPVLGKDDQPDHMSRYVVTSSDNGGVHTNSGIPNKAFYLVASHLGGYAWMKAGRIWYETVRDPRLRATADFSDFAIRTIFNAGTLFGAKSAEKAAVLDAWQQVGVKVGARHLFAVALPEVPAAAVVRVPADAVGVPKTAELPKRRPRAHTARRAGRAS